MTWQIQFANTDDFLIIARLGQDALDELEEYFNSVTGVFDNLNSSVFCSSVIYDIQQHNPHDQCVSINYHIDNEDEVIRITSVDQN